MRLAYLDSSVWITGVEGLENYRTHVLDHIDYLIQHNWQLCTSEAVLLEVTVKPRMNHQYNLINYYNQLFDRAILLEAYIEVFQDAIEIAVSDKLKGLDAIHVAIAKYNHCELFVITDPHFQSLQSLPLYWIDLSRVSH